MSAKCLAQSLALFGVLDALPCPSGPSRVPQRMWRQQQISLQLWAQLWPLGRQRLGALESAAASTWGSAAPAPGTGVHVLPGVSSTRKFS